MATSLTARQLVEAPAVTPLPYGLFSVAQPRLVTDPHWQFGVTWISEACSPVKTTDGACPPEPVTLTPDAYCSTPEFEPFAVYSYNDEEIPGRTLAEHEASAVARLLNGEQHAAEQVVWSTLFTPLTPTDLSGAPAGLVLGYIEQMLADNYFGQGVIHMNRATAAFLWEYLDKVGGALTTRLGTPVIAGGGYGVMADPPLNEFYLVGTGPVVMYRGEVDTRQRAIATSVNQTSYIAQRDYVVGWDCYAVAVKGQYTPELGG